MKKFFLLIFVFSLFSANSVFNKSLYSDEVIMEEGSSQTTSTSGNTVKSNKNINTDNQTEKVFEEGAESPESSSSSVTKSAVKGVSTEESFSESTQMEEPALKPKNKQESELKNIPPANRVEEEFKEEESSNNYLVTDSDLQDLEKKINNLRNQILDTKSKIMELGDRLSQGFISGTKLKIIIDNKLKGSFVPVKMVVKIDGYPIYKSDKESELVSATSLEAFSASVLPENHRIDVEMIVRGKGFGIFTYMEAVKMLVKTTYYLNAPRGKEIKLYIIPYDRGSFYKLQDRPKIKFEVK